MSTGFFSKLDMQRHFESDSTAGRPEFVMKWVQGMLRPASNAVSDSVWVSADASWVKQDADGDRQSGSFGKISPVATHSVKR